MGPMNLRLGIDVDGVLADFPTAFRGTASEVLGTPIDDTLGVDEESIDLLSSPELRRVWKAIVRTPDWWTTLPPHEPEQIKRLYHLHRQRNWEIFFLTTRPETAGETIQFQTQWWLETQGFYLPSVLTVRGSRGQVASALRLNLVVDDQLVNCIDIVTGSSAKAVLLLRDATQDAIRDQATKRGVGVVHALEEAIDAAEHLQEVLSENRTPLERLADWFSGPRPRSTLPLNPRDARPLPRQDD